MKYCKYSKRASAHFTKHSNSLTTGKALANELAKLSRNIQKAENETVFTKIKNWWKRL